MSRKLIVDGYIIQEPIINIVKQLQLELTNGKLASYIDKRDNIVVTCPNDEHKGGHESHPSCSIYCGDDPDVEYGCVNCFTCGLKGPLYHFVATCFDTYDDFGKKWLIDHYGDTIASYDLFEADIDLNPLKETYLSEHILDGMEDYHPYLQKRGISKSTCIKLGVKYDPKTQCVVFPIRDVNGKLKFLTKRNVNIKKFFIDNNADKSNIYLLNYAVAENCYSVVVCESQFNALSCWENGVPGIALLGSGTTDAQINTLNKTSIRHYILAYDSDESGRHGAERFKQLIRKDVFIDDVILPEGVDVNDLTKEEFQQYIGSFFDANV